MKLTSKQEAFAQAIVSGKNQSDAYRIAYPTGRMKGASIHRNAKALTDNTKIASRIIELRAPVIERVRYGYEQAMIEVEAALAMATKLENPSAMVAASALRAKLSGLMVEDRRNDRDPFDGMTTEQLEALAAHAPGSAITH